jgi:hypothetical protein
MYHDRVYSSVVHDGLPTFLLIRSGIRFPQNGCVTCPHLGLYLDNKELININLIRKSGASDLDWLDELVD